ncbi:glycosyl hydrolase [Flagelloscypha sp. PMI_526]|nr:glycosyl hydrolase [Flagelloscypha sp. PMI_526]
MQSGVIFGLLLALLGVVAGFPLESRQSSKDFYGFVYFTGEGTSTGEQIYFAVSQTNSPATWTTVKGGTPVLTSTLGTKGVRDPYIIRDPNSSKLYIIATDLRIYNGAGWDAAVRKGSLSLAIWETTDLKTFSAERLVQVSPSTPSYMSNQRFSLFLLRAPEATWDATNQQFVVYWASNLYASTDTNHTGTSYSRILYSTTKDFKTFTTAKTWIDIGTNTIDTDVAYDSSTGTYYRFTKTQGIILQEKSTTGLFGTWTEVTRGIGQAQFGDVEGPLNFEDNVTKGLWHLFVDDLSPQGYQPFQSTNIGSGNWTYSSGYTLPTSPRHGTVFPITAA